MVESPDYVYVDQFINVMSSAFVFRSVATTYRICHLCGRHNSCH